MRKKIFCFNGPKTVHDFFPVLKLSTIGEKIFSVNESQINRAIPVLKVSTNEEKIFSVNHKSTR